MEGQRWQKWQMGFGFPGLFFFPAAMPCGLLVEMKCIHFISRGVICKLLSPLAGYTALPSVVSAKRSLVSSLSSLPVCM